MFVAWGKTKFSLPMNFKVKPVYVNRQTVASLELSFKLSLILHQRPPSPPTYKMQWSFPHRSGKQKGWTKITFSGLFQDQRLNLILLFGKSYKVTLLYADIFHALLCKLAIQLLYILLASIGHCRHSFLINHWFTHLTLWELFNIALNLTWQSSSATLSLQLTFAYLSVKSLVWRLIIKNQGVNRRVILESSLINIAPSFVRCARNQRRVHMKTWERSVNQSDFWTALSNS